MVTVLQPPVKPQFSSVPLKNFTARYVASMKPKKATARIIPVRILVCLFKSRSDYSSKFFEIFWIADLFAV